MIYAYCYSSSVTVDCRGVCTNTVERHDGWLNIWLIIFFNKALSQIWLYKMLNSYLMIFDIVKCILVDIFLYLTFRPQMNPYVKILALKVNEIWKLYTYQSCLGAVIFRLLKLGSYYTIDPSKKSPLNFTLTQTKINWFYSLKFEKINF